LKLCVSLFQIFGAARIEIFNRCYEQIKVMKRYNGIFLFTISD